MPDGELKMQGDVDVAGYCPMGCGQTLFVGAGGRLTCSYAECPMPTAVDELLSDGDTRHLVRIDEDKFTIQHPLRERVGEAHSLTSGNLFSCELHKKLHALGCAPKAPGFYRVHVVDHVLHWEPV